MYGRKKKTPAVKRPGTTKQKQGTRRAAQKPENGNAAAPVKSNPTKRKGAQKSRTGKDALFTFRRYKKEEGGKTKRAKHPKLIVDQTPQDYGFMGVTESAKRGHHANIPLKQNPQKGRNSPAYIRKELRYDKQENFEEILKNYSLSDEDKAAILQYLENRKKKK